MNPSHKTIWELIEAGGRTAESFGVNRLLGNIYALLYFTPGPLNLDALVEQLGVSKASVSITCRQLAGWGFIRKVWIKGDRKDYYEAETDFARLLNNGLLDTISRKLDTAQQQLQRSLASVEERSGQESPDKIFLKNRLQEAEKYRSRMVELLNHPLAKNLIR